MKSNKLSFIILFFVVFTELIGFGLIIQVLPQLAKNFKLNYFSLGVLMSAYSFAQFFAAPFLGYLSDIYGRRSILIISKLGTCLSYLILAVSNTYWLFLIARLLDGFTGGNIAVARAYITDITSEKDRAKGMAIIGVSFGLGFIVGPAIGGFLHNGSNGQFITSLVAAGLSFSASLITYFYLKEPEKKVTYTQHRFNFISNFKLIKQSRVILIFLIYLVYMITFSGFETTFVMFTDYNWGLSIKQNSFLFMYAGLIGLGVQGFLSRKASSNFTLFSSFGFSLLAIGFLGMAVSSTVISLMISMVFFSFGISFVNTFMPSLLTSYVDSSRRGVIMGMYESIGSLSRILGPLLAYSISVSYIRYEYIGFSILVFLLFLLMYFALPRLAK